MTIDDPGSVRAQYATEDNLELREAVWRPTLDGRDPAARALAAVTAGQPDRVLEVGCGTGAFAERLASELPDVEVIAIDQSARFVELTAARGVEARLADICALPFPDSSFDVVVALWMLYHVSDLDQGLSELRRVLRPGGQLVVTTNGDEHIAELRRAGGGAAMLTRFSSENGEGSLRRHFADVEREELRTRAAFPDHASAVAYLCSSQEDVEWDLPEFEGPREYAGHVTLFTATN